MEPDRPALDGAALVQGQFALRHHAQQRWRFHATRSRTWYREHGYQFLAISDHNYLTDPAGLNAVLGAREKFLLLPAKKLRMLT